MKLKFKDVLPNPWRDLKGNPLKPEKIEELVASINTTGFWDNVLTRKNNAGKYELAYGHHRVAAAMEAGLESADFIVKDLSDALMIQIMDNENREVYASSPASLIEAVKAVVSALAEGSIPPFEVDPKTRKDVIRYAPSFVPGEDVDRTSVQMAYTVMDVAKFLGRTLTKGTRTKPEDSIIAALNALHLKELGKFPASLMVSKDRTGAPKPITTSELLKITTEIKRDVEMVAERRGKSAEEIAKLDRERRETQAKAKADEEKAEKERKETIRKLAEAERAENERKADALKAELKAKDKRAQEKEALNKIRMSELDVQIAAKKAWEAEQRVQDAYMPIRRDVEAMLGKLERTVSESNPFREDVKELSTRKGITDTDKQRIRKALMDVSNWYADWAAPQFAPEMKAAQKRAVDARKVLQALKSKPKGDKSA